MVSLLGKACDKMKNYDTKDKLEFATFVYYFGRDAIVRCYNLFAGELPKAVPEFVRLVHWFIHQTAYSIHK